MNLSISRKNELSSPLSEVLGVIIVAIILYYGGNLVLGGSGELKPEQFMGFLVFYASMIQPAKNFSSQFFGASSGLDGFSMMEQSAGVSDRATKAEISTETAMVMANCW